jgi:ketosteroid isomerase-like protein
MPNLLTCAPASLLLVGIFSCTITSQRPDSAAAVGARAEVTAAMERYQAAARSMNPDSIAAFYTRSAILFEPGIQPIQTRDSIRAFLGSFPGVRVEVATATPDTIELSGNTALYWGSYFERLAFPGQPRSEQHGKFVAQWFRQPDGTWLIHRLFRIPLATAVPPPARAP